MSRLDLIRDESGMTLVELLVATAAGVIVMFGVTLAVIVTLHETDRVATHVDANQRARLTMSKIIEELHSACVAPQIAPVQTGSTSTSLNFLHQIGSAVALTPVLSKISLTGTTLSQSDYAVSGGAAPDWIFSESPSSTVQLMTGVSALSSVPLFRYYGYSGGQIASTALTSPLSAADAAKTVQVNVAFQAASQTTPIADSNNATGIENAALLRLTPPAYGTSSSNLPCQ